MLRRGASTHPQLPLHTGCIIVGLEWLQNYVDSAKKITGMSQVDYDLCSCVFYLLFVFMVIYIGDRGGHPFSLYPHVLFDTISVYNPDMHYRIFFLNIKSKIYRIDKFKKYGTRNGRQLSS